MALAKYATVCTAIRTGNLGLFIGEKAVVQYSSGTIPTTVTVTSGEIVASTFPALGFKEVSFKLDSLGVTKDTPEFDNVPNHKSTISVILGAETLASDVFFTALEAALPCGVLAIVASGSGLCRLYGYSEIEKFRRPLNKLSFKYDSGTKPGEGEKGVESFTLSGESGYRSLPFNAAISATIVGGSATFIDYN